ncbi:alpha/beta fold hydrolase [Dermatobacter hominis]|uniref:alpha/beta fold hydrolase n=1 Tax=Dermatobacter hominis TaxID=2884263 RepID=UPI001D128B18|nr:alpha/beta fold hydrolase [Dermatobacter hominis]UDY34851.1 alpha/beta fold hydrolase [Dermatobacter hominis]
MSIDERPGRVEVGGATQRTAPEIGLMTDLASVATIRSIRVAGPDVEGGDPVELSVAEAGVGGRPLLLVHGFTGAKEDFRDVVGPLAADGHWVVAPDLRGHGASSQPPGEDAYGLDRFAADVLALVDALGWDRFDLLGHSMGGMVAQKVAIERPAAVQRLVLMDTATGGVDGSTGDGDAAEVAARSAENAALMRIGIDLCRAEGMAAVAAVLDMGEKPLETPAHARMAAIPGWREWEAEKFVTCSPDMWCAMVDEFLTVEDRMDDLRNLPMPVLVLVGEQDRPFRKVSARMAEVIGDARLVVVPDAGHSPQFENPSEWYAAVAGFLA